MVIEMQNLRYVLAVVTVICAFAACGADGDPLGGPYGGTTTDPAPSSGDSGASLSTSGTQGVSDNETDSGSISDAGSSSDGGGGGATTDSGTVSSGPAPTWTQIYTSYLGTGTEGGCNKSGCHSEMSSASAAYTWLEGKGQIDGTSASEIADPNQSILSWMGGDMPKGGPSSDATATSEIEAWAKAGAQNN
jgi:hypothetical protein